MLFLIGTVLFRRVLEQRWARAHLFGVVGILLLGLASLVLDALGESVAVAVLLAAVGGRRNGGPRAPWAARRGLTPGGGARCAGRVASRRKRHRHASAGPRARGGSILSPRRRGSATDCHQRERCRARSGHLAAGRRIRGVEATTRRPSDRAAGAAPLRGGTVGSAASVPAQRRDSHPVSSARAASRRTCQCSRDAARPRPLPTSPEPWLLALPPQDVGRVGAPPAGIGKGPATTPFHGVRVRTDVTTRCARRSASCTPRRMHPRRPSRRAFHRAAMLVRAACLRAGRAAGTRSFAE